MEKERPYLKELYGKPKVFKEIQRIESDFMVEIGKEFGGRDHSTVVYAIQQIEEKSARDPVTKATVSDIIKNIRDRWSSPLLKCAVSLFFPIYWNTGKFTALLKMSNTEHFL